MYNNNNGVSNRYNVPVCVCGHAMNLHKFGKIDCNGSHAGSSFFSKGVKCKCLLFVDNNVNNHVVPVSSGGSVAHDIIPPPRVEHSVAPPASSSSVVRSKEDIQAMLVLLQEQLDNTK